MRSLASLLFTATLPFALAAPVEAQPAAAGVPRPEVGVLIAHPQSVAIMAELPGRTAASLTAEVRPQVGGILKVQYFQEGGEVAVGDPLYLIDPAPYEAAFSSAQATLAKARAALPNAQSKVDRYQALSKQNAVAKQDVDDAEATLAQAKADVAVAEAALETARINLAYTTIRAPIAGRIDKASLTPGALVTASQTTTLTTIRTIDPINVDITQSSRRLLDLRAAIAAGRIRLSGDNVRVTLKLENGGTYAQTGTLAFSEANVSQTTGTYTLRAKFPNPDRLLLPGMYVRAVVEEGVAENSFLVPQRAVDHDQKGQATALVVDAEDKVAQRVLKLGDPIGNRWRVEDGLADGDRIIVEGKQRARPGALVKPSEVDVDDATGEVVRRDQGASLAPAAGPSASRVE
ncbi:MAG: efflux RND transporter periplasmic adaptor subunit [Hyphomicrobiales bacterium]|nr:efflux RND transporter periplasmic adaptor subunit [Hyphomicrobiales bacterium]